MTFTLVAFVTNANGRGQLDQETFATIAEAEERMARWARYGVEGQCDDASELAIIDADGTPVRFWHWRLRRSLDPRDVDAAEEID